MKEIDIIYEKLLHGKTPTQTEIRELYDAILKKREANLHDPAYRTPWLKGFDDGIQSNIFKAFEHLGVDNPKMIRALKIVLFSRPVTADEDIELFGEI